MKIFCPVPYGSGAQVVHQYLAGKIPNYSLATYNPYLSMFPPILYKYRDITADLVHAPVDYACFSKHKDIPLVSTVHGYMLDEEVNSGSGLLRQIHYKTDLKYFYKKSLSVSNRVVCVSNYLKNKIINELNYHENIQVIPNGIDSDKFKPVVKNKSEDKIRLLFVGNLRKTKGIDILPSILNILGDRYELLYTSGIKNNQYVIRHENARCIGSISHNEMPDLYNSVDILICPSKREGFGLAIAEAMACGLPVVAANNSAIPELVVDGEGGFLCPTDDARVYADKINYLVNAPQMRKEMGEYNRSRVEQIFDIKLMIKRYKSLFEEVLA